MTRKELRSLLLCFAIGDGCLHNVKNNGRLYGYLTIDHGIGQADYQSWKAQMLSKLLDRNVKCRSGHKGKSVQVSVGFKRMRAWRKFIYKDNKKDLTRLLPFIQHPEFAIMVWLMDDGYVEPSISTLKDGSKVNYGARFRIFTEDQTIEQNEVIIEWFKENLNVEPKIKLRKDKRRNKSYPFLKFTQEDSLKIWEIIREKVLSIKSMQYKFRYIEEIYQRKRKQAQDNES